MSLPQLTNEQSIVNLLTKTTMLKFSFATDGILHYKSITPKKIEGEFYIFEIEVFLEDLDTFFDYASIEDLKEKHQIFRLKCTDISNEKNQELYYQMYDENNK